MSNFKKVLRTCLLFILVVVIFSFCIMEVFFYGENFYYQDIREREELSGTIDYIVCGSSHAMRGVKPEILDEELGVNSYNLSIANVTLQGRYEMLKLELERNPVKTVALGLSFNTMTRSWKVHGYEGDYYVLTKLGLTDRIPYFFESIDTSDYISIYYNFLNKGFECMDMAAHGTWTDHNEKSQKGYVTFDTLQYEGDEASDDRLESDLGKILNTWSESENINERSLEYLNKIVDLCEEHGVQLILFSVPLSKTFVCKYKNLEVLYEWYEDYAQEKGLIYYDFNLYKGNNELFSDADDYHDIRHLNDIGSDTFTRLFADIYTKIENGEDVDDLFYDSYAEQKEAYVSQAEEQIVVNSESKTGMQE